MRAVRLLTGGILTTFAEMVYANRRRLYRLWLVAPWIGYKEEGKDPVGILLDALAGSHCTVTVFSRPPVLAWHSRALDRFKRARATIYVAPHLHTKLYIAECNGFRGAITGSPNLTPEAEQTNRELAIEFRATSLTADDTVNALVGELTDYASSLRGESEIDIF